MDTKELAFKVLREKKEHEEKSPLQQFYDQLERSMAAKIMQPLESKWKN